MAVRTKSQNMRNAERVAGWFCIVAACAGLSRGIQTANISFWPCAALLFVGGVLARPFRKKIQPRAEEKKVS
jgi:hypothetical protein